MLLLAVIGLTLANWACCGVTSTPGDLPAAETTAPGDAAADPTATSPPPGPTVDVSDCTLGAVFAADVTIPDNTSIDAEKSFVKTWSARNTGTCNWGPGYLLTFVDGDQMGGSQSVAVPETVAGEAAEVSVKLVAPAEAGTYRGNWRMCVNETECFGDKLYVQIVVVGHPPATQTKMTPPTATLTPSTTPFPDRLGVSEWMFDGKRRVGVLEISWEYELEPYYAEEGMVFLSLYLIAADPIGRGFNPMWDFFVIDGKGLEQGNSPARKDPVFMLSYGDVTEGWWTTVIEDTPEAKGNLTLRWYLDGKPGKYLETQILQ